MLKELSRIIPNGGSITMAITINNNILSVSILPHFNDDNKENAIMPILLTGTAEELDNDAWEAITALERPIKRCSIILNDIANSLAEKEKLTQNSGNTSKVNSKKTTNGQLALY